MTVGYKVPIDRANDVMDYCEHNNISYGIWNAADFWMNGEIQELTFDSHEDADKVKSALDL